MSALSQKRTLDNVAPDVRFTPESGHRPQWTQRSTAPILGPGPFFMLFSPPPIRAAADVGAKTD